MSAILKLILKSTLSRWVTVGIVTLLLGGGVTWWYKFKADLRAEGEQECVQVINEETLQQLQIALAAEKTARAELQARLEVAARANQEARIRRNILEQRLNELNRQRLQQKENDNEYRAWSDTDLPNGVADRLREAGAELDPGTIREDSN